MCSLRIALHLGLNAAVVWHIALRAAASWRKEARRRRNLSFPGRGNGKSADNINVCPFVAGDCDFEKPFSSCGYTQGRDDDLDWEQMDTSEKPSLDPWVPPGETVALINHWSISGGSCLIVAFWQSFICTEEGQASQWAYSAGTDWKINILNFYFFLLFQIGVKIGGFSRICFVNTWKNQGHDLDMLKVEK